MITVFNRRELTTTFDIKRCNAVRDALNCAGIPYYVKVVNMNKSRGITGSFGTSFDYSYQYTIYVKKSHYDIACYNLRGI